MTSATSPAKARVFNYSFPGSRVQIQLRLDAVDALASELQGGCERGSETGGMLLGRITGQGTSVEIIDATPFLIRTANEGTRYVLQHSDRQRLAATVIESNSKPGVLSVVGYYRTHLRPNLSLDEDDLTLMRECFLDPASVALLIKPSVAGPPIGAFFFRDNGEITSQSSFLELPFDSTALANIAGNWPEVQSDGEPRTSAVNGWSPKQRPVWNGRVRSPRSWIFAALIAGALAFVPYAKIMQQMRPEPAAVRSTQVQPPSVHKIGLQVEKQGTDFRVSWNRNGAILEKAKVGILTIKDGESERRVYLDPVQLQTGTAMYSPVGDVLQFRLEILSAGGESADEQVIAIAGPNAVAASRTPTNTQAHRQPPPSTAVKSATDPSRDTPSKLTPVDDAKQVRALPSTTASAPAELPVAETLPLSPPVLERGTSPSGPGILPSALIGTIAPPPGAPSINRATPAPGPASGPASGKDSSAPDQGTKSEPQSPAGVRAYVPPQALRQFQPTIPASVRAMLTTPVAVEIQVSLDENGRVTGARVQNASGPMAGFLARPALDTARRWTFRPASIGNRNVPSEITLQFRFNPGNKQH